ncbi:hypothetical protein SAMD00023353_3900760 [Rosellinia necatrix]|uniref:Uncharacterized protein n=1 Tax=Rosellinia necatrix TaxID=77044 RepID=A0A1S8A915_ROSNE|nr:hypothetical protein SAMD00023353_3900760 [Rosellinia necatrix]
MIRKRGPDLSRYHSPLPSASARISAIVVAETENVVLGLGICPTPPPFFCENLGENQVWRTQSDATTRPPTASLEPWGCEGHAIVRSPTAGHELFLLHLQ